MTMRDPEYEQLRSAIREVRVADEREAPSFDAVLARRAARSVDPWRVVRLALAAGVLLAAGMDVARRVAVWRARIVVPREVIALSTWRPLTAVLLETPNRTLLSETPRLGASLIAANYHGERR